MSAITPVNRLSQHFSTAAIRVGQAFGRAVKGLSATPKVAFNATQRLCSSSARVYRKVSDYVIDTIILDGTDKLNQMVASYNRSCAWGLQQAHNLYQNLSHSLGCKSQPSSTGLISSCALVSGLLFAGIGGVAATSQFLASYLVLTAVFSAADALTLWSDHSSENNRLLKRAKDKGNTQQLIKTSQDKQHQANGFLMPQAQEMALPLSTGIILAAAATCTAALPFAGLMGITMAGASTMAIGNSHERSQIRKQADYLKQEAHKLAATS